MYSTAVFESGATLCQSVTGSLTRYGSYGGRPGSCGWPVGRAPGFRLRSERRKRGTSPTRGKSAGDLTYPRCHTENLPPHVRCDGQGRSPRPHVLGNQTALSVIKAQGFRSRDRVGQSRVDPRRTTPRVVSH